MIEIIMTLNKLVDLGIIYSYRVTQKGIYIIIKK